MIEIKLPSLIKVSASVISSDNFLAACFSLGVGLALGVFAGIFFDSFIEEPDPIYKSQNDCESQEDYYWTTDYDSDWMDMYINPSHELYFIMKNKNKILILDFGSQYTQLIARRVREIGVFSEVKPSSYPLEKIIDMKPSGIILSGGPETVTINSSH